MNMPIYLKKKKKKKERKKKEKRDESTHKKWKEEQNDSGAVNLSYDETNLVLYVGPTFHYGKRL